MTTALIHILVGLPLLVAGRLIQLIPLDYLKGYSHNFWAKFLSKKTMRAAQIYSREVIRFILLLIGVTQLWAGIRDW